MGVPRVSILTPTLNSARTLPAFFRAVRAQNFPQAELEVVVADGGSSDQTVEIARANGARIVENPLRTGEAGKAVALRHARGEFVAFVDSDNILVGDDWLQRMLAPFELPAVAGAEPMAFLATPGDSIVDRYCAAAGVNDPLCLFLGNYDKWSAFTGRWTGLPIVADDCGDYVTFSLAQPLPTIGANGTIYRKAVLDGIDADYFVDIDVPWMIAQRDSHLRFAKVRTSIRHLYCANLKQFALKQRRRVRDYLSRGPGGDSKRAYPWKAHARAGLTGFLLSTLTIAPLIWQSFRAHVRFGNGAVWFHPVACWITLWVYGSSFLFAHGRPLSREKWQIDAS